MVTFWFQATQGASFAHGWRNFDPPRFAPTQFHHLLNEEDHIHSFPQIHTKRITSIRVVLA